MFYKLSALLFFLSIAAVSWFVADLPTLGVFSAIFAFLSLLFSCVFFVVGVFFKAFLSIRFKVRWFGSKATNTIISNSNTWLGGIFSKLSNLLKPLQDVFYFLFVLAVSAVFFSVFAILIIRHTLKSEDFKNILELWRDQEVVTKQIFETHKNAININKNVDSLTSKFHEQKLQEFLTNNKQQYSSRGNVFTITLDNPRILSMNTQDFSNTYLYTLKINKESETGNTFSVFSEDLQFLQDEVILSVDYRQILFAGYDEKPIIIISVTTDRQTMTTVYAPLNIEPSGVQLYQKVSDKINYPETLNIEQPGPDEVIITYLNLDSTLNIYSADFIITHKLSIDPLKNVNITTQTQVYAD